jgi:hypothetical protein
MVVVVVVVVDVVVVVVVAHRHRLPTSYIVEAPTFDLIGVTHTGGPYRRRLAASEMSDAYLPFFAGLPRHAADRTTSNGVR